ncbi:MAG: hypothetical protein PHY90_04595 [Desulfitobacteriaceae bacterium]|nr:hypothetical protein [Desulfitobacteriaceae bacterium]
MREISIQLSVDFESAAREPGWWEPVMLKKALLSRLVNMVSSRTGESSVIKKWC